MHVIGHEPQCMGDPAGLVAEYLGSLVNECRYSRIYQPLSMFGRPHKVEKQTPKRHASISSLIDVFVLSLGEASLRLAPCFSLGNTRNYMSTATLTIRPFELADQEA